MAELPYKEHEKSLLPALPIPTKFAAFSSLRIPDLQVFPHVRIQAFAPGSSHIRDFRSY